MIQLFGALDRALRSASMMLSTPWADMVIDKILQRVVVALSFISEASAVLETIRQLMDNFCALKNDMLRSGWPIKDGKDFCGQRRKKLKENWLQVLPQICWESEPP